MEVCMITRPITPTYPTGEQEADILVIRYVPGPRIRGKTMKFLRPILKWFSLLSTIALGAAALAPDTFNVPAPFRPWVFLTFVFWFFAYCAGFFNL
jgi:hypothetical protein